MTIDERIDRAFQMMGITPHFRELIKTEIHEAIKEAKPAWSRGIPDKPGYYWMRSPGKAAQPVHVATGDLVFAIYFDYGLSAAQVSEHEFCPAIPPE